jgi:hypothetical protein
VILLKYKSSQLNALTKLLWRHSISLRIKLNFWKSL